MTVGVFSLDNEMRKCVRDEWLNKRGKDFWGVSSSRERPATLRFNRREGLNSLPYGPAHLVPVNPNWISMLPCTSKERWRASLPSGGVPGS